MTTFSKRVGIESAPDVAQVGSMNDVLRASLWNVMSSMFWEQRGFLYTPSYSSAPKIDLFSWLLWARFFKRPVDERPNSGDAILVEIRKYFFAAPWNKVYEFIDL